MSTVLSLSGALADCIAFGVPTVTTQDVADEMSAPSLRRHNRFADELTSPRGSDRRAM